MYVWVPKSGRASFSQLVFDTLRYATKDPSASPKKEVTIYLDSKGNPTQSWLASQVVKGEIKVKDKNSGLASNSAIPAETDLLSDLLNGIGSDNKLIKMSNFNLKAEGTNERSLINQSRLESAKEYDGEQPVNSGNPSDINRLLDFNQRFLLPE